MIGNLESLKAELSKLDEQRAELMEMIRAVCPHSNIKHVNFRHDGG